MFRKNSFTGTETYIWRKSSYWGHFTKTEEILLLFHAQKFEFPLNWAVSNFISFDLPVLQVVVVPYHQRFCFNIPFLYRNFSIRNTSDPDWFQLYPSDTHSAILPAFVHRVRLSIGCCCLCSSFICHSSLLQQHHIIFLCINMSHGWIKFCILVFIGHFYSAKHELLTSLSPLW